MLIIEYKETFRQEGYGDTIFRIINQQRENTDHKTREGLTDYGGFVSDIVQISFVIKTTGSLSI
jgi:hypothetical protein